LHNIFVNGTFDVIHHGHISLLNYARTCGDRLFVGIDSDRRVAEKKGPSRPINSAEIRRHTLMSLKSVDEVIIFDSDKELEMLVKQINPRYLVIGDEYRDKEVIGGRYAEQIVFFPKIDGYSSTKIIQSLNHR